jgi:hypothetical protein
MSSEDLNEVQSIIDQVRRFATDAANASGLPGGQFGPRDALRHIIGSAELTRRLGLLRAYVPTEGNEIISAFFQRRREFFGQAVAPSLLPESRAMDRANNAIGQRIGTTAATANDVLERARGEVEAAFRSGPGLNGRADWLPPDRWTDPTIGSEGADNWPPRAWPSLIENEGVGQYLRANHPSVYQIPEEAGGGPVFVRPHMREGHPVSGYQRQPPHRQ